MRKTPFTIRARLLAIIAILNLIIAALVGNGVYNAALRFSQAQKLKHGTATVDILYNVNKNLSLERGASLSVMYAAPETAGLLQEDILKNRARSDEGLASALSLMTRENANAAAAAVKSVEERYQALRQLREEIDAALAMPIERRDLTISDRYFKTSTGLIAEIQNLILIYAQTFQAIDASVARKATFKYFVWELSEYAGEEYAIIGRLIVEDKYPTQEQQDQLLALRGRIHYGWEIIRKFSLSGSLEEKLLPYMEEAEAHYFFTFEQIKDLFYGFRPLSASANYPLSIKIWLGMASQAVNSLLDLQDEVLKDAQRHVDQVEQETRRDIVSSLLIFGSALAMSLYCWSVIVLRVTRPVNAMVDTLYKATQDGGIKGMPELPQHHDEIGKLARVLEVFQDNARRMKQSNEELERYAYITAHDLKSPLRAIDNLSQWIEEDLDGALTGKSREYMVTLRQRVRRMEKLLNDTLEYSKIGVNPAQTRRESVNGRILLDDTVSLISPPKGFTVNIDDGFNYIALDRFPLQQIFYNLINNAIKHHESNSGIVSIGMENSGDRYIFTVRDDGPGIPSRYHEKIFEMYQTLKPRDQTEGSGMGLAFVKKILASNGGAVTIESEPGKGTLFRFTWPKPEEGEEKNAV